MVIVVLVVILIMTNVTAWACVCFFFSLPRNETSGVELIKNASYKYLSFSKIILAIIFIATSLIYLQKYRMGDENLDILAVSISSYFLYGFLCYLDSIRALKAYLKHK